MSKPHNFRKAKSRLNGKFYDRPSMSGLVLMILITGITSFVAIYGHVVNGVYAKDLGAVEHAEIVRITPKPTLMPTATPTVKPRKHLPSGNQTEVVSLIEEIWGIDKEIGKKIAFCESSWGINVKNSESSASGVFQIIKATWISNRKSMGEDTDLELRFDPKENIKTAYHLYQKRGTSPWNASKWCWSK